jgi:hypothetical protein
MREWHERHNEKKRLREDIAKIVTDKDPTPGECVNWVNGVLQRLNLDFNQFFIDARKKKNDVAREPLHSCWTAHLWADYALYYCSTARKMKGDYVEMTPDERKTLQEDMKKVPPPIRALPSR